MSVKPFCFGLKAPCYFQRDYENDISGFCIGQDSICKRVALVALPFLSLYAPLGKPIAIGMGSLRFVSDLSNLCGNAGDPNLMKFSYELLQTAIALAGVAGSIFAHPAGMLITTGQDLLIESASLINFLQNNEYQKAMESCANIVSHALYLGMFFSGGLELAIVSLAMQVVLGLRHAQVEFDKGNHLEGSAHLAMSMIRGGQLIGKVQELKVRWEAERVLEVQKEADFKRMTATIEDLQRQLLEKAAELETTSTEFMELQQQLLETQKLQNIMVSYGNNSEGLSTFHYAIKVGDTEALGLLLKHGACVNAKDKGIYALHRAVMANQVDVVRFLLDQGADMDAYLNLANYNVAESRLHSIHEAAKTGGADLVNLLLDNGADVNESRSFYDQWHETAEGRWSNIIIKKGIVQTPLYWAADSGNFDAIKTLVNRGADVNYGRTPGQSGGETPLDRAVRKLRYSANPQNLDIIKFLIEHGAERNNRTYNHCPVIAAYLQSVGR